MSDEAREGAATLALLLDIQGHDTVAAQLRHRRRALPARERMVAIDRQRTDLSGRRAAAEGSRDQIAVRQGSFEAELASVEAKKQGLEARLYSGTVTVPRELQAMEVERDALARRVGLLEDEVLAAMGERDPFDEAVTTLTAEIEALDQEHTALQAEVTAEEAVIDAELTANDAARQALAAEAPADLLDRYERLRDRLGGVGIATIANGRCGGCHLDLPATELDRMRHQPPGTIAICEQCGRMLVLPSASG